MPTAPVPAISCPMAKIGYRSKAKAILTINRMRKQYRFNRGKQAGRGVLESYFCKLCSCWHIWHRLIEG